ncbi:MAG: tetratricopeptide repeat protein [Pseudanabaena sp. CAN_BIN31]|nr:tetratricopeptide repeat protein [Pseudanabaena sp. CAN_BIN31]
MNDTEDKLDFALLNNQSIQGLLSLLDLSDGFTIALAECNFWQDGVAMVAALNQEMSNDPEWEELQLVDWEFNDPDLRYLLDELVERLAVLPRQEGKKLVVVLRGLENAINVVGDYPPFLVDLNFVRDGYIKKVPHPVVFVLPDYAITRFTQFAPDFWAWKSGSFRFQTTQEARDFAVSKTIGSDRILGNYIKPEKQERIDLLHRLLMEANPSGSDNPNISNQIEILNELGNAYDSLSKYNEAIKFHQQALEISRKVEDRKSEAVSLKGLGNAYASLGQYQQAIQFHQQSLEITKEIGDRNGEAKSLGNLGIAYNSLGQYQQAIQFHQQSLEIKKEIGDRNGEAASLGNLGIAYNSLGQYQQAIQFQQQSLEIKREIGDRNGEANSLGSLGNAYNSLGQYQQAIQFHQQTLEIKREIGDCNGEAASLGNLGSAYFLLGQYEQAIQFYQKSLEIDRVVGDRQGESASLGNLGNAYGSLGQYQQAIQFLHQQLGITREIGDRNGEANSLNNLGVVLKNLGRRKESIEAFNASRQIYEELGLYHMIEGSDKAFAPLETVAKESKRFSIKDESEETPEWYQKSMPNYQPQPPKRSSQRKNPLQKLFDWFRRLWSRLWQQHKNS